ncbi:PEP/pyruvate-binding domain-containing protein [bacterium]|nr:PEP/pyruvate-binding domain-containing protein [bacterium]
MEKQRLSTGLDGLDRVLDWLRPGDNVVWSVDDLEHYQGFVRPFARLAARQGRRLVYMRFARHAPLVECAARTYELDANRGFESFTGRIHEIVGAEGEGAFYVFDCLSNLLSAWATDLMVGNFFRVTCPYLFELDTVAYFGLLRESHSFKTIDRIRETTQLMLEVHSFEGRLHVHPLKVDGRYSPTMFLPHVRQGESFEPVADSHRATRLLAGMFSRGASRDSRRLDYWDRLFLRAGDIARAGRREEQAAMVDQLCRVLVAREERMLGLARRWLGLDDLLEIKSRMVGTGFIGGKALGMLLARSILRADPETDWQEQLEPHDSFFVGSDVFYSFLVHNGLWRTLMRQKSPEGYYEAARELREGMRLGEFPAEVRGEFSRMLDYFGQYPIIVRSSSLLEDAFGNAFAGKYKSFFLVNQGDPDQRLEAFETAVREVFASTMSEEALAYRKRRGLDRAEEQMALLVQRVSGRYRGDYYYPDLAGVGVSFNTFVWNKGLDPQAGMLRLVMGLGTRAVDRVEGDYPRIAALDDPMLRPLKDGTDLRRYSQRDVDLLNLRRNALATLPVSALLGADSGLPAGLFCTADTSGGENTRQRGQRPARSWVLTFDPLLESTDFCLTMRRMLGCLERAYSYPVDIEFTVNFGPGGERRINLLQCRPLQTRGIGLAVQFPEKPDEGRVFFRSEGNFMGGNLLLRPRLLVWVDPAGYSGLSLSGKYELARLVGALGRNFAHPENCPAILAGPGRWGTTTPSLGVPVSFSEIGSFSALAEVAFECGPAVPELSFGTHFFQDLVESGVFYVALFPGQAGCSLDSGWPLRLPNRLEECLPGAGAYSGVLRVCEVEATGLTLASDIIGQRVLCWRERD